MGQTLTKYYFWGFFNPTKNKIILTLILFIIISLILTFAGHLNSIRRNIEYVGAPFPFYTYVGCGDPPLPECEGITQFSFLSIIIDILIFYIIACFIIQYWGRNKKIK